MKSEGGGLTPTTAQLVTSLVARGYTMSQRTLYRFRLVEAVSYREKRLRPIAPQSFVMIESSQQMIAGKQLREIVLSSFLPTEKEQSNYERTRT